MYGATRLHPSRRNRLVGVCRCRREHRVRTASADGYAVSHRPALIGERCRAPIRCKQRKLSRIGNVRHVGFAFEEPSLFSASVRENLLMGKPDAHDDELREALAIAQADFVFDLPWGLETRIGEQGLSLSGGQRQRLALARAIIGRPRVLVLDDPLSALDVHTEALVEGALRSVLAATTALVVAHRPSTVLLADRVALLAGGRIAAVGTHSALLADVPAYRDLLAQDSDLAEVRS